MAVRAWSWLISDGWAKSNESSQSVAAKIKSYLQQQKKAEVLPKVELHPYGEEKLIVVPKEHVRICNFAATSATSGRVTWHPHEQEPVPQQKNAEVYVSLPKRIPHTVAVAALVKQLRTRRVAHQPSIVQEGFLLYSIEDYDMAALLYCLYAGLIIHNMYIEMRLSDVSGTCPADARVRHLPKPQLPVRTHSVAVQAQLQDKQTIPPASAPPAKRKRPEPRLPPKDKKAPAGDVDMTDAPARPRQCWKCQAWGHQISTCEGTDRCRRCAGHHRSSACDREAPVTCANCAQPHAASSATCPLRPLHQQSRVKRTTQPPTKRRPAPTIRRRPSQRQPDIATVLQLLLVQMLERHSPPVLPRRPRRRRGKKRKPPASA